MLSSSLLRVSILACAIGASMVAPAAAQDSLARAETAIDEGDLERASELLASVTSDASRPLADVAHAYALLGVVRSTLGEDAEARRAFEWALALDPALATPAELGPTQRTMLDELRARRRGRPLDVTIESPSAADVSDVAALSATVSGAPDGESITLTMIAWPDDDELSGISSEGRGSVRLTVPSGAWPNAHEIHVRAEARTGGPSLARRDARIHRRGVSDGGGEVWQEAWFWVVIGVVVAGAVVGTVLGLTLTPDPTLGSPMLVDHLP